MAERKARSALNVNMEMLRSALEREYTISMTVNLTKNEYSVLTNEQFVLRGTEHGRYDSLIREVGDLLPDARQRRAFTATFSRESLTEAFGHGETERSMVYRLPGDDGAIHLTESRVFLRRDDRGDLTALHVARAMDERTVYTEVATALSGMYDSIYYVDLTEDSYIEFGNTGYFDNRGLEFIGEDFFEETRKNFALIVYGEDQRKVQDFMDKARLTEQLDAGENPTLEYRLLIDGKPVWHRMRVLRTSADAQHIIIIVRQVDGEVRAALEAEAEKRRNFDIIGILASEYSCVYYIDLEADAITPYSMNEDTELALGAVFRSGIGYSRAFRMYAEQRVLTEDRQKMLRAGSVGNIIRELRGKKSFVTTYRAANGHYAEMKFVKVGDEEGAPRAVALGFADKDAELRARTEAEAARQRNIDIIGILASEYSAVYYLDLATDELTPYTMDEGRGRPAVFDTEYKYAEAYRKYVSSFVFTDDREMMLRAGSAYNIFRELRDSKTFSTEYRSLRFGAPRWCEMKFVKVGTEENPRAAVICFADKDKTIRADKQWREEIERLVDLRTAELRKTNASLNRINEGVIDLLGNVVESRDETTGEHIRRVRGYTAILARCIMKTCPEYGLNERRIGRIVSAAALHDVGKVAIPDSILRKPGRLTDEEFALMKTHSAKGCEILQHLSDKWDEEYLRVSMEICRSHHEKWDGMGYPDGLSGDNIPISAQIVSVADIYDALTTKRVYKDAYTPERAYEMIMEGRCGAFSPKMLACIAECRSLFAAQARSDDLLPEAVIGDAEEGFYVFTGADSEAFRKEKH